MKRIIFGMVVSTLLSATGFLNMLLIIQRGGAGPAESLSALATVCVGFFLFLVFEHKREKLANLNTEYPRRELL